MVKEAFFDRYLSILQLAEQTRLDHQDKPQFEREWEVFRCLGVEAIVKPLLRQSAFTIQYGYSELQLTELWNEFIDKAIIVAQSIISDLDILSPDYVVFDRRSPDDTNDDFEKVAASLCITESGKHILNFSSAHVCQLFLVYVGDRKTKDFQRHTAWYEFGALLAHELRHSYQHHRYPQTTSKIYLQPYQRRLTEYDARLYSLHWLRKQKATTQSQRVGLWLARAGVIVDKIVPFGSVRDRVNRSFGLSQPTLLHTLKLIFTSSL